MKKLFELRQQKADLTTQMRSLLTQAEGEKRSLNTDEAKQFDELRTQSEALNTEIARYEALSDEERNQAKNQPTSKTLSNDELRHYYLGIHPSEIWPSRYFDINGQLIERIARKVPT
ncbi:helix-turn-helix domain-containing protein [Xenorhabdus griffiniae]|uniref:helix-turn-helix domain-containing protein n=1 Tax=Xenorhabdus griffiniae TaxID=351672 RepID=UPI0030D2E9D6